MLIIICEIRNEISYIKSNSEKKDKLSSRLLTTNGTST